MADDPLDRLRAALAEAWAIYDSQEETPTGETGQIAGAVNAVHAVLDFLRESGIDSQHMDPLLVIEAAFRDHNVGKPHPIFARKKQAGGRNLSQINVWRATVAAAVKLQMRAGDSKKDAIRGVAQAADVNPKLVKEWHRDISTERIRDDGAIQIYKSTLAKADEAHPDSPARAAEQLLAALTRLKL